MSAPPYFRPPADYEPPTRCTACDAVIRFGPVIGGCGWSHTGHTPDHHVVPNVEPWWNTGTGTWRTGWMDADLEAAMAARARESFEEKP